MQLTIATKNGVILTPSSASAAMRRGEDLELIEVRITGDLVLGYDPVAEQFSHCVVLSDEVIAEARRLEALVHEGVYVVSAGWAHSPSE